MTEKAHAIGWFGLSGVALAAGAAWFMSETEQPATNVAPDIEQASAPSAEPLAPLAAPEAGLDAVAAQSTPTQDPSPPSGAGRPALTQAPKAAQPQIAIGETARVLERDEPAGLSVTSRPSVGGREVSLVVKLKDAKLAQTLAALYERSPGQAEARVRALLAESKVDPKLIEGLSINGFSLGGEADIRVKLGGGGDDLTQRTRELAVALERAPGVAYAEPNYEAAPFGDVKP